jgi:hypothetical protein
MTIPKIQEPDRIHMTESHLAASELPFVLSSDFFKRKDLIRQFNSHICLAIDV